MNTFTKIIAQRISLPERGVDNTLALIDEGCTTPFISRYRKERTGSLDEVQIESVRTLYASLSELAARKETILRTIETMGKLTPALRDTIAQCWDASTLEDLYLPYKPRRRTRAQVARSHGLEPLATLIMLQREHDIMHVAQRFVKDEVGTAEQAVKGAQDIIAETISEDSHARQDLRRAFRRAAIISCRVVKDKKDTEEAAKYADYFDFSEPLRRCSSHRLLAMRRGMDEHILRIDISPDQTECMERLRQRFVRGGNVCARLVAEAADDAYKRLLKPAIETEFMAESKQKADEEAIRVFADNLRQLLLAAPLGQRRVLAIDPGFRTGCKVVCLSAQGTLLHHGVIYPHPPHARQQEAARWLSTWCRDYAVEAIAIGNGTASRETEAFVRTLHLDPAIRTFVVSEDGASVYSASAIAREEFPEEDVTVRGAVSIGRRLIDPLAELVKIDPKSIGVGQYQHDVDQTKLRDSLHTVVESCVNAVGVDVNTASSHLLTYVSGLNATTARNIVSYRDEHGPFSSRAQLKKVPRIGAVTFEQCAGFLRIAGGTNPLDNSAVHPESYALVERMAHDLQCSIDALIGNKERLRHIDLSRYVTGTVGLPTLTDIIHELEKPGRDPRAEIETFAFDEHVHSVDDLEVGMVLPGIVTNITNFGAFVDIGVHQDGLVHISQMADRYVSAPGEVVHLHQHVTVRVCEIDTRRKRISLSMRNV